MKNEWEIEGIDVPIFDLKMHGSMNKEVLKLHAEFMGRLTEETVNFKSRAIREALIAMGWTTPETGKAIMGVLREYDIGDKNCKVVSTSPTTHGIYKSKHGHYAHYPTLRDKILNAINQTDPASN